MSSSAARYFPGVFVKRNANGASAQISGASYGKSESSSENVGVAEAGISDEALVRRLQEKDISALGLLYRRYARLVYSLCSRIIRDSAEAEDLVHEVFLSLYKRCGSFDPEKGTARSWLVHLTYHRCFDWRDYLKARHGFWLGNGEEQTPCRLAELTVNRDLAEQASRIDLKAVLAKLPREQQLAFKLRVAGYSWLEIAEKLGCSDGNAKNHVYRGIRRLRGIVFDGNRPRPDLIVRQGTKPALKNAAP